MKRLLLLVVCLAAFSFSALAQEEVKVLKMTAVRTNNQEVTVSLYDADDFLGPKAYMEDKRLVIGGRSMLLSRVREIRFFIDTEVIDEVKPVEVPEVADIYSLDGRLVRKNAASTEDLPKGLYIMSGKKMVVK
jgi:hypothetical protein